MTPTRDFLARANRCIREVLIELRPRLLEAHGAIKSELKSDSSVVTAMDLLVEERLKGALAELDPVVGFAGEETGGDSGQETFWLVDPIDGTEMFIRGQPFATNMIALVHRGAPIMSVIYNFVLGDYYHCVLGGGATLNGHPIHVTNRPLGRSYVEFSSRVTNRKLYGITDRFRQKVRGMPQMHASGYVYTAIASGALDGVVVYDSQAQQWDHAPGTLLVKEAGGRVENPFTGKYDYRDLNLIASSPDIFPDLKEFIEAEIAAAQL